MNQQLVKAARIVTDDCLGIRQREQVIIVIDETCREIGYALMHTAQERTDPVIVEIVPRDIHGQEPPSMVAELLKKCDVFIMPTSKSLSHTQARIRANRNGARGVTMPGITTEIMTRTLNADYRGIARLTRTVADLLTQARSAHIETHTGTSLDLDLTRRPGHTDTGIVKKKGDFSNLPAGEAYIAPIENKSVGKVVVDGSFAPIGALQQNVIVEVANGRITRITGNKKLNAVFHTYGSKERTLCEFGIGTNPKARISGNVLEDEKVRGSIHVAFGNNLAFGGINDAKIHLDGVVSKPTVWLDKTLIIKNGTFVL
ncbi:aminopeptidase [candidate division WOR-3 bacterium]|nr:aminopeptidase [candidate division WOR-3 bacterium]